VVLGNGSSGSYYGDEDNPYDSSGSDSGGNSDSDFNSSFNKTNTFTRFEDKYLTPGASCRRSV
jgi:hypothetical protein